MLHHKLFNVYFGEKRERYVYSKLATMKQQVMRKIPVLTYCLLPQYLLHCTSSLFFFFCFFCAIVYPLSTMTLWRNDCLPYSPPNLRDMTATLPYASSTTCLCRTDLQTTPTDTSIKKIQRLHHKPGTNTNHLKTSPFPDHTKNKNTNQRPYFTIQNK